MSEKLFDLFVRNESEDDVAVSPSPQSSLKSFRDTFKRSDNTSSQTATIGATSSSLSNVTKTKAAGKLKLKISLYFGIRISWCLVSDFMKTFFFWYTSWSIEVWCRDKTA